MILLKTHKVLSHTQVPFSKIIQITHCLNYYIFFYFFSEELLNRRTTKAAISKIEILRVVAGYGADGSRKTLDSQHYNTDHPPSSCLAFPTV